MDFFHIDNVFFEVLGSEVSYLEFLGTITGAAGVWLAAKTSVWSWPVAIVSVTLVFFLFYQVQLYPDMFLQVFFFVTSVMGWWRWTHPKPGEEDRRRELKVSFLPRKKLLVVTLAGLSGTLFAGLLASRLHTWLPSIFTLPSAYPYLDSFVAVVSVFATFLMVQKKVECWMLWIAVDAVAAGLYFAKDIRLFALEYVGFCFLAAYGLINWVREYKTYQ